MADKIANIEVVQLEGDIHIDAALVPDSVYVTGYNPAAKSEELIIHFQRKRNGGGDIKRIVISKRGAAVITFENPEGKMLMVNCSVLSSYLEDSNLVSKNCGYERSMFNLWRYLSQSGS